MRWQPGTQANLVWAVTSTAHSIHTEPDFIAMINVLLGKRNRQLPPFMHTTMALQDTGEKIARAICHIGLSILLWLFWGVFYGHIPPFAADGLNITSKRL